ncbi:hypothetical protein TIFTF001_028249 [Ficus carica]|uniref:Uncharacterized protein n=1 Tax=Ficus carica TaxID=3494 RepID=A0AA88J0Y5_FICCA|nr:hypothetical protein TIFTF001_028249 [Ficus carica]
MVKWRLHRVWVLAKTRSGRLPRVPDGSGKMPTTNPADKGLGLQGLPAQWIDVTWGPIRRRGQEGGCHHRLQGQHLPGYVAAGGDVMCCSSRWAALVADGYRDKACEPTTLPEYVVRSSETARVGRIITPGQSESGSRPDFEQTGIAFPLLKVVESGTLWSEQITTSTDLFTRLTTQPTKDSSYDFR